MESPNWNRSSSLRNEQLAYWLIWNIILPTFCILLLWPINKFVLELPQSFERSFGDGNLLLFSALLLIATSVRAGGGLRSRRSRRLSILAEIQKILALAFFMIYSMLRADIAVQSRSFGIDESRLTVYSLFSLGVLALAISLAVVNVFWTVEGDENGEAADSASW